MSSGQDSSWKERDMNSAFGPIEPAPYLDHSVRPLHMHIQIRLTPSRVLDSDHRGRIIVPTVAARLKTAAEHIRKSSHPHPARSTPFHYRAHIIATRHSPPSRINLSLALRLHTIPIRFSTHCLSNLLAQKSCLIPGHFPGTPQ